MLSISDVYSNHTMHTNEGIYLMDVQHATEWPNSTLTQQEIVDYKSNLTVQVPIILIIHHLNHPNHH